MNNDCIYKKLNLKFKIVDIKGKCKYNLKKNETINLNKPLCLSAIHTAFPYYFTLIDEGWFKWEKNKNSVTARCPNPEGIVMRISRTDKNTINVKIIEKGDSCPIEYKLGSMFNLDFKICPKLFDVIYPLGFMNKDIFARCPSYKNEVIVKLSPI